MLTARCAASCSAANARRLSPSSNGVSPAATMTVPLVGPAASIATRTACAVPSCFSCTASSTSGTSAWMCGPTCSRWVPTTATIRCGSIALTAASTCPIIERPPTGCSTFIVFDFIRVPPPAARTITVRLSMLLPSPWMTRRDRCATCSPGRSRTYVANPDSKSGGPCRQTNRGKLLSSRKTRARLGGTSPQPGRPTGESFSRRARLGPASAGPLHSPADQPGKASLVAQD